MNDLYIPVPVSNDIIQWLNFIRNYRKKDFTYQNITIDFRYISYLNTDKFVLLACLIESHYHENCEVIFKGGTHKLNEHLNNINFKNYWQPGYNRKAITKSQNNTTLCLWKISKEHMYSYSSYAQSYFEDLLYNHKRDFTEFNISLKEVFNNIFDHSKSEITGYVISQYYPTKNMLSFSICDFGIGIPTCILNSNIDIDTFSHSLLIDKSLEDGVSSRSTPQNRGMGLNSILNYTKQSNGALLIVSNNGYLRKDVSNKFIKQDFKFDFEGTLINVQLDLRIFGAKDFSEEILDF